MILRSILRGIRQTAAVPGAVLLFWLANLVIALPAGILVSESLEADIDSSLVHKDLLDGFDMDWYSEQSHRARGLATTFEPTRVVGVGPFLDNLEAWTQGNLFEHRKSLIAFGGAFALCWAFLLGGFLGRLARPGSHPSAEHFFGPCGHFFFRLLRLAMVSAPIYYGIYRLGTWLLGRIAEMSGSATRELPIFIAVILAAIGIAFLLNLVRMTFDYAKIILVSEERYSVLGAALSGARFVLAHPVKTITLYGAFGLMSLLLMAGYAAVAPGTGQSSSQGVLLVLAFSQLYFLAKIFLRLSALSGQMEAYRWSERR